MRSKTDAIAHCERHIERAESELKRREGLGASTERLRNRLKTLQSLRAVHVAARDHEAA